MGYQFQRGDENNFRHMVNNFRREETVSPMFHITDEKASLEHLVKTSKRISF